MALKRRKTAAIEVEDKENCPTNVARSRNPKGHVSEKETKSVEQIYQKKSQLEHILLRPDSYVGSIERQSMEHWVFQDAHGRMEKKTLEYTPALYKIFDEILVNAADNLIRDPSQDMIRVEVKRKEGSISIWNNGAGLPVQMHKEHQCYVPELVFGQLLTSDNYDDNEKKVVGGRNGYGAKLTNIFSTKFILETADSKSGKKYKQVWEKNMTVCHKPTISSNCKEDYTQVTFFPDFPRFGMKALEEDIVALMRRRAFDVAASTRQRCKVVLDGKALEVSCFQDYVDLFLQPEAFRTCQVVNDRWEVALGLTDGSGFQQMSFVNSINTSRGGTHVAYITDQVVSAVLEKIGKQKNGGHLAVKSQHVKSYLWVFINCLVENPAFDSQTKETLTSKRERFGSTCRLPEELLSEQSLSEILVAYNRFPDSPYLISGERNCWPWPHTHPSHGGYLLNNEVPFENQSWTVNRWIRFLPEDFCRLLRADGPYPFPNIGLSMGPAKRFIEVLKRNNKIVLEGDVNDQGAMWLVILRHSIELNIQIDQHAEVFLNMLQYNPGELEREPCDHTWFRGAGVFGHGRPPRNLLTNTTPGILHFNGPSHEDGVWPSCYHVMTKEFRKTEQGHALYDVDHNMLVGTDNICDYSFYNIRSFHAHPVNQYQLAFLEDFYKLPIDPDLLAWRGSASAVDATRMGSEEDLHKGSPFLHKVLNEANP